MSDCCSPGQGFPPASAMEQMALNHPVIWREICAIQQAILAAASQCQPGGGRMCTLVGGDTPMTYLTGVKSVRVESGGAGYVIDRPAVKLIPPIHRDSGLTVNAEPITVNGLPVTVGTLPTTSIEAVATVVTNGGKIMAINVTDPGAGYLPVPSTLSVTSSGGVGARLAPLIDGSTGILGATVISGGVGYQVGDAILATRAMPARAGYVDAMLSVDAVSPMGTITGVRVARYGSGYQDMSTVVEIVSNIENTKPYPLGAGFSGRAIVSAEGKVTSVVVDNGGSGYADYPPFLAISDPGTGAITRVNILDGSVTRVDVISPGLNYTAGATGVVMNPPTAPAPTERARVVVEAGVNPFGTQPELYYQVWAGLTTNKAIQLQMEAVVSYFTRLGYTITVVSNPATGSTILWKVCW